MIEEFGERQPLSTLNHEAANGSISNRCAEKDGFNQNKTTVIYVNGVPKSLRQIIFTRARSEKFRPDWQRNAAEPIMIVVPR